MNAIRARFLRNFQRLARNLQTRRSGIIGNDFNVVPRNTPSPSCLQSLQKRFFRRKTRRVALRRRRALRFAVSALGIRINAHGKTRRSRNGFADAINFDNVYADGNDHK